MADAPVPAERLTGVIVRTAQRAEVQAIAAVVRDAFETVAAVVGDIPPIHERPEDVIATFDSGDITLVAEIDRGVVGTVRGETMAEGSVMIRRLAVLPEHRNRGIAHALMDAIETAYPHVTRFELFTGATAAGPLALYESLGYRPMRSEDVGQGLTLVYLEKRLG